MSADVLDLPIRSSATEAENSLRDELPSVGPVICYRDRQMCAPSVACK